MTTNLPVAERANSHAILLCDWRMLGKVEAWIDSDGDLGFVDNNGYSIILHASQIPILAKWLAGFQQALGLTSELVSGVEPTPGQVAYRAYRDELFTSPGLRFDELEGRAKAAWEAAAQAVIASVTRRIHVPQLEQARAQYYEIAERLRALLAVQPDLYQCPDCLESFSVLMAVDRAVNGTMCPFCAEAELIEEAKRLRAALEMLLQACGGQLSVRQLQQAREALKGGADVN